MESANDTQIKTHETASKHLGYALEFKTVIHEHPGILKTALRLAQKTESKYHPSNVHVGRGELEWNDATSGFYLIKFDGRPTPRKPYSQFIWGRGVILAPGETTRDDNTGLEITALAKTKREFRTGLIQEGYVYRIDESAYFKIKFRDKAFFIKKSVATNNPGYTEFKGSVEVASALTGIENLGVVKAQLGYHDTHQSWFVSEWKVLEKAGFFPFDSWLGHVPNDYGKFLPRQDLNPYLNKYKENVERGYAIKKEIEQRLNAKGLEIHDLDANLFYNPNTGQFFLLDITLGPPSRQGLRQPK